MKKISSVALAFLMIVLFVFSASYALAGDKTFKRVPGEIHQRLFPEGHGDTPAVGCYYDDEENAYFCSLAEEAKLKEAAKTMKMGGEAVYKRVPAAEHKRLFPEGHADTPAVGCYYDEEESVYFCSLAENAKEIVETTYKMIPAAEHKRLFPEGHADTPAVGCYYDEEESAYFCSFDK